MEFNIFGMTISAWVAIPVVLLTWISVLFLVKKVVFQAIKRLTRHLEIRVTDIIIGAADVPLTLLIIASGGIVIEPWIPSTMGAELTKYILITFKATVIIAAVLFFDKFLNDLIHGYSDRVDILKSSGGIARGIVRIVVIGLGLLILLDSFGVSVTPLLASLGIGSLAVALALQPTLENFFSGIQLVIDKPIQVGHFIKLESGEEGYVHRIGWRSTWVRLLPNNVIVIPNKALVSSKVLNYYYPAQEMSVLVQVGVHYDSDLEHVEQVTIEVAREALKEVPGCVAEFEPFIRYHTFADFSINFSVILRVKEFVDNYLLKHEFIKRLHKRYAQEGIVIPYPIRAINTEQEHAAIPGNKES